MGMDQMIHYHGTPLTPKSQLFKMAGKHFCVSFARPENADWCMANGQSVMWDNGAFSAFRLGKKFDQQKFSDWVGPRLGHPHWAVIPDVIDGSEADQEMLIKQWAYAKELSAPVWHIGLSLEWLIDLATDWPRICFGSSGEYWQIKTPAWKSRIETAFRTLDDNGLRPWVHMLRGLDLGGGRFPFASADSVNVARNFKNKGREKGPEEMARQIDSRQCPIFVGQSLSKNNAHAWSPQLTLGL